MLSIDSLNRNIEAIPSGLETNTALKPAVQKNSLFEDFYNAAIEVVDQTSNYILMSDKIQQDFAAGKTDDLLSVMMAQERANSSLTFTVSVTNKIIEAYKEIMRMQI